MLRSPNNGYQAAEAAVWGGKGGGFGLDGSLVVISLGARHGAAGESSKLDVWLSGSELVQFCNVMY